jgi:hypothetical protein
MEENNEEFQILHIIHTFTSQNMQVTKKHIKLNEACPKTHSEDFN